MSTPGGVQGITDVHVTRGVELVGGSKIRDVYDAEATTTPSGVYFQFRVPVALADPGSIQATAEAISVSLESLFTVPGVVGIEYVQDVSPANLLVDYVLIYVQSTSGLSTDYVRWPLESVDLRVLAGPLAAAIAKLDTIEALT